MEGPQIRIYRDRLRPLAGQEVTGVAGNRAAQAEPFLGQPLPVAECFGKLLFLPFNDEALRLHCLMFGDVRLNQDRPGKRLTLRLALAGEDRIDLYLGAAKRVPTATTLDLPHHLDLCGEHWDPKRAWRHAVTQRPDAPLTDVLLDQALFPGLGNKIKTDALWAAKLHPLTPARMLSAAQARRLMAACREYADRLGTAFLAGKRYDTFQAYRAKRCPRCGTEILHGPLGDPPRQCHWCPTCQPAP